MCDEGHRLKSKDNKTTRMFRQINTTKRISVLPCATSLIAVLSGTPVQNDLGEYFSMVDFVCPAIVGTYQQFVKLYERPIVKSRTPGCPEAALEVGRERADEVSIGSRLLGLGKLKSSSMLFRENLSFAEQLMFWTIIFRQSVKSLGFA